MNDPWGEWGSLQLVAKGLTWGLDLEVMTTFLSFTGRESTSNPVVLRSYVGLPALSILEDINIIPYSGKLSREKTFMNR